MFGGKNSIFRKPLGTGKKSVAKAVSTTPILSTVQKAINDVNENIGPKKISDVYQANKAGIDGLTGLAARGTAAYFTLGASELVGGGEYLTNQFGRKNDFAQYGKASGMVGSIAGVGALAKGTHALNSAGWIAKGSTASNIGVGVGTLATGGRAPASVESENNLTGGEKVDNDFWNKLGDFGLDYLNNNVLNNGSAKDRNVPTAQPVYTPPAQPMAQPVQGISQNTMLMIGGALVLVLLLVKR